MRFAILLACSAVFLGTPAFSADLPTVTFDPSLVSYNSSRSEVCYADFGTTTVSENLNLASQRVLIELHRYESVRDICWQIIDGQALEWLSINDPFYDEPTALDGGSNPSSHAIQRNTNIGVSPVYPDAEIQTSSGRFVRLLLLPVTVDSSGTGFCNVSVCIYVGERLLEPDDLVPYDSFSPFMEVSNDNHSSQSTLHTSPDYVIITSSTLTETLQQLATYKTATGYVTEVKAIEDILTNYTGRDDAEKLREYLKDFYNGGGHYALLAGDENVLPYRYAYHATAEERPDVMDLQIADLYFGDLTGEWDVDNDDVWGEYIDDMADFTPELVVGRLPFSNPEDFSAYIDKLITYETSPGGADPGYLSRAFFFSSDQMRDYQIDGQHHYLAAAFPDNIDIDTINGVESPSGSDPAPDNPAAFELYDDLSEGFGFVNILAHGRCDAFAVRTSLYNTWPKSYFITEEPSGYHGTFEALEPNDRLSFYYSVSCDFTAFDQDKPPFNYPNPLVSAQLMSLPHAGAVGVIGYSRWGWVSKSHLLQRAFLDSLFAHPERSVPEAMYAAQAEFYYYRDLVLGQNYHGDPTLKAYTAVPAALQLAVEYSSPHTLVAVKSNGKPVEDCSVYLSKSNLLIEQTSTDAAGDATFLADLNLGEEYKVSAVKQGYTVYLTTFTPSITTDIIIDETVLPSSYTLSQNYPNPFNPTTNIEFELPQRSMVDLTVFNVLGQNIVTLVYQILPAGKHEVIWHANNRLGNPVPSGVYFYRLKTENYTNVKKMVLLR